MAQDPSGPVELPRRARILEHVHGLLAGGLLVAALFLAILGTVAAWAWLHGRSSPGLVAYPLMTVAAVSALLWEARSWRTRLEAASGA